MVHIYHGDCSICGKHSMLYNSETTCRPCQEEAKKTERRRHFEDLDKMSLENRIRRIEEILYDEPWEHTHPELMRF